MKELIEIANKENSNIEMYVLLTGEVIYPQIQPQN
jgi:hypothetical protein